MWYRNFIVFVIFVVVDETISGKVQDGGTKETTISGLTRCTTQRNYFALQPRILTVGAIIQGNKTGT